jgi:hypothetical protein
MRPTITITATAIALLIAAEADAQPAGWSTPFGRFELGMWGTRSGTPWASESWRELSRPNAWFEESVDLALASLRESQVPIMPPVKTAAARLVCPPLFLLPHIFDSDAESGFVSQPSAGWCLAAGWYLSTECGEFDLGHRHYAVARIEPAPSPQAE